MLYRTLILLSLVFVSSTAGAEAQSRAKAKPARPSLPSLTMRMVRIPSGRNSTSGRPSRISRPP